MGQKAVKVTAKFHNFFSDSLEYYEFKSYSQNLFPFYSLAQQDLVVTQDRLQMAKKAATCIHTIAQSSTLVILDIQLWDPRLVYAKPTEHGVEHYPDAQVRLTVCSPSLFVFFFLGCREIELTPYTVKSQHKSI